MMSSSGKTTVLDVWIAEKLRVIRTTVWFESSIAFFRLRLRTKSLACTLVSMFTTIVSSREKVKILLPTSSKISFLGTRIFPKFHEKVLFKPFFPCQWINSCVSFDAIDFFRKQLGSTGCLHLKKRSLAFSDSVSIGGICFVPWSNRCGDTLLNVLFSLLCRF